MIPDIEMAAPAANTAAQAAPTAGNQRYSYRKVTSLESPTTSKPRIPGVEGAEFTRDVNLADMILRRNTDVRAISAFTDER
jgi:hypothetical protein